MARVPYVGTEEILATMPALHHRLQTERKVPTANIFLALANTPSILEAFLTYANAIRASELDANLRELAILTVGHCTQSEYEIAHHHSHGLKAGLSEAQLEAVPTFETSDLFDDKEKAIMAFAKASTLHVHVDQAVWDRTAAFLSKKQMVELALNVAWYNSGVRIMGSLGIELEDSYRHMAWR